MPNEIQLPTSAMQQEILTGVQDIQSQFPISGGMDLFKINPYQINIAQTSTFPTLTKVFEISNGGRLDYLNVKVGNLKQGNTAIIKVSVNEEIIGQVTQTNNELSYDSFLQIQINTSRTSGSILPKITTDVASGGSDYVELINITAPIYFNKLEIEVQSTLVQSAPLIVFYGGIYND